MKKSIITGLCALLAVLYIFKVYKINTEFKSPKEEIIPFGTERVRGWCEYESKWMHNSL